MSSRLDYRFLRQRYWLKMFVNIMDLCPANSFMANLDMRLFK